MLPMSSRSGRVDAHQHFWRYDPAEYPWIDARMAVIAHDFLPGDLEPLLADNGIDRCVAVQARQSLEETRFLLDLAANHDFIAGVVGWVDLCADDAETAVHELRGESKLVGLRHVLQDEPDDAFCLRGDFRHGVALLADAGLTYDILIHPRHVVNATKLVDEFREQSFVLDHLAKPYIRDGILDVWVKQLKDLAILPNVHVKLSGLVTEASWGDWKQDDFVPYLDAALDAFGEDRIMFGSDWPVCTLAASYEAVVDIVTDWAERALSDSARAKLFSNNAVRFDGLS